MIDQRQNSQIELQAGLARAGGSYHWNAVPISDSQGGEHSGMLNTSVGRTSVGEAPPFAGSEIGEKILGLLDRLSRKRAKKNDEEEDPNDYDRSLETSAAHARRVRHASGKDRNAAFDLAPLPDESLHDWHGRLHTLVNPYGGAHCWFAAIKGLLERTGGLKKFSQLSRSEQAVVTGIVKHIAAAA